MLPLPSADTWPGQMAGMESSDWNEERLLSRLSAGGFVHFHRPIAQQVGYKAALFLGHCLYWHRYVSVQAPRSKGWFFLTADRCTEATGLTTREQAHVRETLGATGAVIERIGGRPARLHYRLNLSVLQSWTGLNLTSRDGLDVATRTFGHTVSYYAPLATISGSVAAGLYLSYLLRQQHQAITRGAATLDGFFAVSQVEIRDALCLSTKVQRNARDRLRAEGFIQEHGTVACHVDLLAVVAALGGGKAATAEPRPKITPLRVVPRAEVVAAVRWLAGPKTRAQVARDVTRPLEPQRELFNRWLAMDPAGMAVRRSVTRMFTRSPAIQRPSGSPSSSAQVTHTGAEVIHRHGASGGANQCQKVALLSNQGCPFVESTLPFCRNYIKEEEKDKKTTTVREQARAAIGKTAPRFDKRAGRRRSSDENRKPKPAAIKAEAEVELRMPKALDAVWHASVRFTLDAAPLGVRQSLLDELEGQLSIAGKTIHNPPGWLHGLIAAHRKGGLVLALAEKVATDRKNRERVAAKVASVTQREGAKESAGATPSQLIQPSSVAKVERERLRALRRKLTGRETP